MLIKHVTGNLIAFMFTNAMCGSRKYPYPHHGGNWKFRGGGGSKTQEIPEGRGVERSIWFPDALRFNTDSKILSYLLSKSFT